MFGKSKPQKSDIQSTLEMIDGASIESLMINDRHVRVILGCTTENAPQIQIAAEEKIKSIKGVKDVQVIVTAEKSPVATPKPARAPNTTKIDIDAKRIIAVSSGKGGVGKSTIAMNLAFGLSKIGEKVGLLDADIYGPSVPRMTGLSGQKPEQNDNKKIVPLKTHGVDIMSIGFMVDEEKALVWRGAMVQKALVQLLQDVTWEGLDTLIIDMPPGTGDVQLTLSQRVNLNGAIIVSTPQDIALIDARKGIEMFKKVDVPITGLIENMSHYCCPQCGHQDDVFGNGGAKAEAEKLNIPYLGDIPLNSKIRAAADRGEPITEFYDDIIRKMQ